MFDSPDKLILGLVTGIAFGFLLQKGRVAKFEVIVGQFLFRDWTVVKTMGTAVVVGAIGVYALVAYGRRLASHQASSSRGSISRRCVLRHWDGGVRILPGNQRRRLRGRTTRCDGRCFWNACRGSSLRRVVFHSATTHQEPWRLGKNHTARGYQYITLVVDRRARTRRRSSVSFRLSKRR